MFCNWFKKKKFEDEIIDISNGKKYKDRFNRYIQFLNASCSNKVETARYINCIIVEYLNFYEAVQSLEFEHEGRRNTVIEEIYENIESKLNLSKNVVVMDVHEEDKKFYEDCKIVDKPLSVNIVGLPILLNPWNGSRIIKNLNVINEDNLFDGEKYSRNVENTYLYPMDIFVCEGANHSQFAAKFKNQGITIVKKILNFSELYDCVYFDGEIYRFKNNEDQITLNYSEEDIFYSGIIFEMGRFIIESDYHRFELTKDKQLRN